MADTSGALPVDSKLHLIAFSNLVASFAQGERWEKLDSKVSSLSWLSHQGGVSKLIPFKPESNIEISCEGDFSGYGSGSSWLSFGSAHL